MPVLLVHLFTVLAALVHPCDQTAVVCAGNSYHARAQHWVPTSACTRVCVD